MDPLNIKIQCNVENCYYNHNQCCHAEQVMVNAMGDGIANSVDGTCCCTFQPKA
ncbi:MAG: DUF1540 domain-containing protein [Bacillota bacterium]|nr:DUF1540 domain-containing protein [Bacillota bacterium]